MRLLPLAVLSLLMPLAHAGTPLPDGPHVVSRGEGKVVAAPDVAVIEVDIEGRGASAAAAKALADRAADALLAATTRFEIATKDIDPSSLRVGEDVEISDGGRRVSNGFEASRRIEVKLRDLARFNEFLDAALAAGNLAIRNITFEASNKDALLAQARLQAVRDAHERAQGLARAFDARLGAVYSIESTRTGGMGERYQLDRIEVTGSRIRTSRDIQPQVEYTESIEAVFDLLR